MASLASPVQMSFAIRDRIVADIPPDLCNRAVCRDVIEVSSFCTIGRNVMKLHIVLAAAFTATFAAAVASPAANASVHFASPLAATRYFAAAVDSGNTAALHRVTTPAAYKQVMYMRTLVRDVHATSCTATGRGDYECLLQYRYTHQRGNGSWHVIVAPAVSPGWYVYEYAYQGCD
jgi:hypothetical protein